MTAIAPDESHQGISPDLYMLFRLLGTAHSVTELLDTALRDVGLSAESFRLLSALVNAPEPLASPDLQAAAFRPTDEIERLVDTLERDGFVRRSGAGAGDGRRVRLVITARGRARQHAAAAQIDAVGARLSQALTGLDPAAVGRALSALR